MADDVERRCRAGLAAAAGALYGRDGRLTAAALHDRAEERASPWPWLPGPCYRAVEPLGVRFAEDDRAAACAGKVLLGRPVRPDRLSEALRQLRDPDVAAPADAPEPEVAAAVDRFWDELAGFARRLGRATRAGDEDAVHQLVDRAREDLRERGAAVRAAAERAAAEPTPDVAHAAAGEAPVDVAGWAAPGSSAIPDREAEEDVGALGPDRPYAPLIFAGAALTVALLLLLVVAAGGLAG